MNAIKEFAHDVWSIKIIRYILIGWALFMIPILMITHDYQKECEAKGGVVLYARHFSQCFSKSALIR